MRKLAELNLIIYDIYLILNSNTDSITEDALFTAFLVFLIKLLKHFWKGNSVFRYQTCSKKFILVRSNRFSDNAEKRIIDLVWDMLILLKIGTFLKRKIFTLSSKTVSNKFHCSFSDRLIDHLFNVEGQYRAFC